MELEEPRPGLVRPVRVDPTGVRGPTPGEARGRRWRRTSRGFYVPADVDSENVDQRIVEASVLVPEGCAITGWAALRWSGGRWFEGTDPSGDKLPVPILISTHDIRPRPGIRLSGEGTSPDNIVIVDGIPITVPVWSTVFAMRYAGNARRAAMSLEMAAYNDLASVDEATALVAAQSGWTGVPVARKGLPLAGENAWSPPEVLMKIAWHKDGGYPAPLQNRPVFDLDGHHIGTPDLIDPVAGVIGEYDGRGHLRAKQRVVDVRRAARFAEHELESAVMLAGDPIDQFLDRLAAAYRRARRRRTPRTWTVEPPPWWVPTFTVEQRRALTPEQRAKLLRYRGA